MVAPAYPLSVPPELKFDKSRFWLKRQNNSGRTAGNDPVAVDIAPPVWVWEVVSSDLDQRAYGIVKAWLMLLEDGLRVFEGSDPMRQLPHAYDVGGVANPGGWTGTVSGIVSGGSAFSMQNLPGAFIIRAGDPVTVVSSGGYRHLFMAMEDRTATGGGALSQLEVRPHVPGSMAVGDTARWNKASCYMRMVPGSVDYGEANSNWPRPVVKFTAEQTPRA